jgi:hypothetical protein
MGYSWTLEDRLGKEGHGIAYIIMRKFIPTKLTLEDNIRFIVWFFERAFARLPLRAWRQGTIYIEDLNGVGMKNMGSNKDQKALQNAITNALPLRISKIFIVNPGWIFKVLIKIAKWIMKAKIVKRVEVVDQKTLLEKVPKECVLTEFGGEYKFSYDEWIAQVAKEEMEKEALETKATGENKDSKDGQSKETVSNGSKETTSPTNTQNKASSKSDVNSGKNAADINDINFQIR